MLEINYCDLEQAAERSLGGFILDPPNPKGHFKASQPLISSKPITTTQNGTDVQGKQWKKKTGKREKKPRVTHQTS